jgi:biotin transport system substrate-specific component
MGVCFFYKLDLVKSRLNWKDGRMSQITSLRTAVVVEDSIVSKVGFILGGVLFLAAMAQISFPIPGSPVPVTGQTLGTLLLGTAYGATLGFTTLFFYLLAGVAGAPIFTSHTSGVDHLSGATGGYLIGMLVAALVTGYLAGRKWDQRIRTVIPTMLIGTAIIFTFGLAWLHYRTGESWSWTISKGLSPFIIGEALKIAIASTALPTLWKVVRK